MKKSRLQFHFYTLPVTLKMKGLFHLHRCFEFVYTKNNLSMEYNFHLIVSYMQNKLKLKFNLTKLFNFYVGSLQHPK